MQERDMKILQLISDTRLCTTKQIQEALFQGVVPRVCYRRLQSLIDSNLVKRKYYRIDNKNMYVYFLDKPPGKKNLKHDLLITEFYIQLIKNGYEIISFEKSPIVAGIVPDAEVWFKSKESDKIYSSFLEVQLSEHDCLKKYYNLSSKANRKIPSTLYIVSDKKNTIQKLRDFQVVLDDLEMKKINQTFGG